ncbi:DNA repair protein RadC [Flavobacteriaceae bacterium]|nr:DNA repair protein RadC [Flavobacteriaceae bacterium]
MENIGMQARERLIGHGAEAMTHAELIALIIRTGDKGESAVRLAQRLLDKHHNNLKNLAKLSVFDLMAITGFGRAKSCSLLASFEISRRLELIESQVLVKIQSSKDVYIIMKTHLQHLEHEEFWVLFLNNSNRVKEKAIFSKGGITGTLVDIRLILKRALLTNTTSLVLCHNHPSGSLLASQADKQLTRKLSEAARYMDIQVLDHLIITEKDYFSFADDGLIN